MASMQVNNSGTTSVTVTLVSPPGKVDGAIGLRTTVLDSVTISTTGGAAAVTAGIVEIQNNGSGVGQLCGGFQVPANQSKEVQWLFPGGFPVATSAGGAGTVQVLMSGFTGATASRLVVTYHFE